MNPTRDIRGHFLSLLFSAEIGLVNNFELYDSENLFCLTELVNGTPVCQLI